MRTSLVLLAVLTVGPAWAQPAHYPSQPIHIIVSVPAGGGVDTAARLVAEGLRQRLGQPTVVENKGGQAGNLAGEAVFNAAPDGYTLMASQPAPITVNPLLYKSMAFDPTKLTPVAIMTSIPNVLAVRADLPVKSVAEFIAYAKANPGKLNYGSQGTGTTSHLTAELLQGRTGIKLVHVPYKGTAPALNDLIAGHIDLAFNELASTLELHRAGKVRILAVAAAKRSPLAPDIPTMAEAGVPDFESGTWNAITAPPKTPDAVVATLNAAILDTLRSDAVAARLRTLGMQAELLSPAEAGAYIAREAARWAAVIRAANIPAE